jgi:hypothetical protein
LVSHAIDQCHRRTFGCLSLGPKSSRGTRRVLVIGGNLVLLLVLPRWESTCWSLLLLEPCSSMLHTVPLWSWWYQGWCCTSSGLPINLPARCDQYMQY